MLTSKLLKNSLLKNGTNIILTRNGHIMRGKQPGIAKSLEQRIEENEKEANPNPLPRVNIGFAVKTPSRAQIFKSRLEHIKKNRQDSNMEKLSRSHSLIIDLDQVSQDSEDTSKPFIIKRIADHYGIYNDLFDNAYFIPRVNMDIRYVDANKKDCSVSHGNIMPTSLCISQPRINFNHNKQLLDKQNNNVETSFWTILMVSPDTHLFNEKHVNCLNWFVSNIPNGEIKNGEERLKYLQPFPVKGFGYQRNIFLLFKQKSQIDFEGFKTKDTENLLDRKFNLLEFYRQNQENITPVGLSFFQCEWDDSVTNFFQKRNVKEPVFVYDFPKPYLADQKWFPLKQPFNLYMDKHRSDPSKINKEYLRPYLFKDLNIPIKYPMAHPIKGIPSWMIAEIKKERLKLLQKSENFKK